MSKIFCIGFNKTGTTSLHVAFTRLGFKSLHHSSPENNEKIRHAIKEGKPMFHYFDEDFDAYSDFSDLTWNFNLADKHYPGSKFIMTWRELDPWLKSRNRHVKRNILLRSRGRYQGNWLTVDADAWTLDWFVHQKQVDDYFCDQQHRLLKINICGGQGYELLCPFLNRPTLNEPFPWDNKRKSLSL